MKVKRTVQYSSIALLGLTGCGGGGSSESPTLEVIQPTLEVVEPPVIVEPPVLVQMSRPTDCLTEFSGTGGAFEYLTCDGVKQSADIDYPYDEFNTDIAIVDLLAVVDIKLDLEGLSYEEFVQRELDFANQTFEDSGVYVMLRLAGVKTVDVSKGDLYRQIDAFTESKSEFTDLDEWQKESRADYAFLFKKIEDDAFACGVALLKYSREDYKYRRGVTQCFQNTVFQSTSTTRYYERAHETFTHEMGHLFGLEHDVDSATTQPMFEYSYGYLLPGYETKNGSGYGTVMSYSDLGTGRFSDRSERFEVPETGLSQPLGQEGTDAVEHINRVRYYMSQLHEMFDSGDYPTAPPVAPTPEPRPPRTPVETDTCGDTPENVFCGVPFSANALNTYVDEEFPITIPAGKIHASRFTTAGSIDTSGAMRWHSPSWANQSQANVWISKVAGGDPVGEHCTDSGSSIIDVVYGYEETQYDRCVLEQGQEYYANFRYTSSDYSSSMIQTVNTRPGEEVTPEFNDTSLVFSMNESNICLF